MRNVRSVSLFVCLFSVLGLFYQSASSQAKRSKAEWADRDSRYQQPRRVEGAEWSDEAVGREIYERAMELNINPSPEQFQCLGPYGSFGVCDAHSEEECLNAAGDFCGDENIHSYSCGDCDFQTAPPMVTDFSKEQQNFNDGHPGCTPESDSGWFAELTFRCTTSAPKAKKF